MGADALPAVAAIDQAAAKVQQHAIHTQDRTPWWAQLAGRWAMVLIIGGIVAVLVWVAIYFGQPIKRLSALVGSIIPSAIPRAIRDEAEADAKTIASGRATDPQQIRRIETRKQTDPQYRAALARETQRVQPQKESP